MEFDTQLVNLGKKFAITMVSAIFLGFAWFGLVLPLVFVPILNTLTEPVPTKPQTP